jgi:hypothetical protein
MKETHPFNRPAEDGCLEVFRLSKLATFEDGDRVDYAEPSVKFTARDVVVHTLSGDSERGMRGKAAVDVRTRR